MGKLSKRERILLAVLAIVIISVFTTKYILLPAQDELTLINGRVSEASIKKIQMYSKLSSSESISRNIEKSRNEIASLSKGFYAPMTNEEISRIVLNTLKKYGIQSARMNISEAKEAFPDLKAKEPRPVFVKKCYVAVQASGTLTNLFSMIDEVNAMKSLRISSFSAEGDYKNTTALVKMSIDFEVFMYESKE